MSKKYIFSKERLYADPRLQSSKEDLHSWSEDSEGCEVIFESDQQEWGRLKDKKGVRLSACREWCDLIETPDVDSVL